jgi:hypothetical protein
MNAELAPIFSAPNFFRCQQKRNQNSNLEFVISNTKLIKIQVMETVLKVYAAMHSAYQY